MPNPAYWPKDLPAANKTVFFPTHTSVVENTPEE